MLSIINAKLNINTNVDKVNIYKSSTETGQDRHYPPANKEWLNSIYAYNKNTSKTLSVGDKITNKMIKSYLNLYNAEFEKKKIRRVLRMRQRRLSTKRILVSSRSEIKHTNDKVIITVYVYNREKIYYLKKMFKARLKARVKFKKFYLNKITTIKKKAIKILYKVRNKKNLFLLYNSFKNIKIYNSYKKYENYYYINFIYKSLRLIKLYLYYKRAMLFNKSKFDDTRLIPLTTVISKIYKKNVSFNFVSLKYLYLNSDIWTETMALKLKNKNNRLLRVLNRSLLKIKVPLYKKKLVLHDKLINKVKVLRNIKVNSLISSTNFIPNQRAGSAAVLKINDKDTIQNLLDNNYKTNLSNLNSNKITDLILNSLKYKFLNGIRIEASGRLTRRKIAARSIFKYKYIGNIQNKDSSFRGLSSVILRGHIKSNLQYTAVNSKTRIGSFGLKGWISSN